MHTKQLTQYGNRCSGHDFLVRIAGLCACFGPNSHQYSELRSVMAKWPAGGGVQAAFSR